MSVRPDRARIGLSVAWSVVLLAVGGLILVPLGRLAGVLVFDGWKPVRAALAAPGTTWAVAHTIVVAAISTAIALPVGVATALAVERLAPPARTWLRVGALLPLIVPHFVLAFSWVQAYGRSGLVDDVTGIRLPGLIGPVGVALVLAVTTAPLAYLVVASGIAVRAEPDLARAARVSGASGWRAFTTVTLPLLRPAIVAAGAIAFAAAVESFAVPAVLGIPSGFATISTRIYQDLNLSANPDSFTAAIVLSLVMVLVILAVVAPVDRMLAGQGASRTGAPGGSADLSGDRPISRRAAVALAVYLAVTVGVPLVALVASSLTRAVGVAAVPSNWTLANFDGALGGQALPAIGRSLGLAATAGACLVVLGGLVATLERRVGGRRRGRRALGSLVTLTFALPGSALAVGLLVAYGGRLGGSLVIIFLAYLAKLWTLAHRPIAGSMDRIPADVQRSARISGAGPFTSWRTVTGPLLAPALLGAFALVFLFAFHELTMSTLLYGPGSETLGVVVLNLKQLGEVGRTSALAVLMALVTAAAAFVIVASARWARRLRVPGPGA
jgi:iron(III) transport system permease protein